MTNEGVCLFVHFLPYEILHYYFIVAFSMTTYNQEDRSYGTEELIWDMVSTGLTDLTEASCQLSYLKGKIGPWYLLLLQSM